VESADPFTPEAGKPQWPSIKSQLKNQFTKLALTSVNMTGRTCRVCDNFVDAQAVFERDAQ
jgi:hypothetical protein